MAIIKGLLKRFGKYRDGIYPYTQTDCVFDENGNSLDGILSNINTNKQNTLIAGRGIGITGNTINNNFESLIGDATIATGDKLVIRDASNSNNLAGSSITFGTDSGKYLANNGKWEELKTQVASWGKTYSSSEIFQNQTITISNLEKCSFVIMAFIDDTGSSQDLGYISFCYPKFDFSGTASLNVFRAEHGGNYRTFRFNYNKIVFANCNSTSKMLPTMIRGFL